MRFVLIVVLSIILTISSLPNAKTPPAGEQCIDLRADSIAFTYPHPDSIRVEAFYTILNATPTEIFYYCDIGVFLDGIPADVSELEIGTSMSECWDKEEEDCDGDCTETINGKAVSGICIFWKDPIDTCFATCVCSARIRGFWGFSYAGEDMLSFELDLGDTVLEVDETNNSCSIFIGPVGTEETSWGSIKTLKTE